jgi:hypothetical protein
VRADNEPLLITKDLPVSCFQRAPKAYTIIGLALNGSPPEQRKRTMDKYKVMSWGPAVGLGVTQSKHLHLAAIGKKNDANNPYYIINEVVAAEIGRRLRIPVPPSCVVQDEEGNPFFASLNFNLTGDTLPPIIPATFRDTFPGKCAEIVVFDSYIANPDRHPGNLSADYAAPARFNIFDHSHALLGSGPAGVARLPGLVDDLGIGGHCLKDVISDDRQFGSMLERVEALEEYFIRDVIGDVSEYGLNQAEGDQLIAFLLARRGRVRGLMSANKASFPGIQQWSLL